MKTNQFNLNGKVYKTISNKSVLIRVKPVGEDQFATKAQDKELILEGTVIAIPMEEDKFYDAKHSLTQVFAPITRDFVVGDNVTFKTFSARKRGTMSDELGTSDIMYVDIEGILDVEVK